MPTPRPSPFPPLEVVDPFWLVKALAFTLVAALGCAWLVLCLLFYQGQWQFVLHPQRTSQPLNSLAGIAAVPVRFDVAETGVPRLSGALLPASQPSRFAGYTVFYVRGGKSSLAQSPSDAAAIRMLHDLGLSVFAFDYRGFGFSDPEHPNLERMTQDTDAGLRYLLNRDIPEDHVIVYGEGVGTSLAVTLVASHPGMPVLILDSPAPASLPLALFDPRTRALPVRLLFHEEFSLDKLARLPTPKLLISVASTGSASPAAFTSAATPKMTIELPQDDRSHLAEELKRFLDQYLTLTPHPSPP